MYVRKQYNHNAHFPFAYLWFQLQELDEQKTHTHISYMANFPVSKHQVVRTKKSFKYWGEARHESFWEKWENMWYLQWKSHKVIQVACHWKQWIKTKGTLTAGAISKSIRTTPRETEECWEYVLKSKQKRKKSGINCHKEKALSI